jgi:hypothetical protein
VSSPFIAGYKRIWASDYPFIVKLNWTLGLFVAFVIQFFIIGASGAGRRLRAGSRRNGVGRSEWLRPRESTEGMGR